MDTKKIKANLKEMKKYADQFPINAGMKYISECAEKTLELFDSRKEIVPKVEETPPATKEV